MRIVKDWVIITIPRVGSHYLQERIFAHTNKKLVLKYHEPVLQTWGYATPELFDAGDSASKLGMYNDNWPKIISGKAQHFWSGLDQANLKVMTIVRDPSDLLISDVAMAMNKEVDEKLAKLAAHRESLSPYDFVRDEIKEKTRKKFIDLYKDSDGPNSFNKVFLQKRISKYATHYLKLKEISTIVIDYDDLVSFPFEVTCAVASRMNAEITTDKYSPIGLDKNNYLVSSKGIYEYDVAKEVVEKTDLSEFYEAYNKIKMDCISL